MVKIGAVSSAVVLFMIIFFLIILPLFSSALFNKDTYVLGEKVRIDLRERGNYKMKIIKLQDENNYSFNFFY